MTWWKITLLDMIDLQIPQVILIRTRQLREGFKKMWIFPHLGEWVSQDGDKIHKKKQKKTCL